MDKMNEGIQFPLMKALEVAKVLNISRAMAYRLMKNGEIPTVCIGRARRVRHSDLQYYIAKNVTARSRNHV